MVASFLNTRRESATHVFQRKSKNVLNSMSQRQLCNNANGTIIHRIVFSIVRRVSTFHFPFNIACDGPADQEGTLPSTTPKRKDFSEQKSGFKVVLKPALAWLDSPLPDSPSAGLLL